MAGGSQGWTHRGNSTRGWRKTKIMVLVILTFATRPSMHGQTTTTTTNCNVYGNTANCTSTSSDDSAQKAQQAEQQRQAYETGQKLGAGLAFNRNLRKYCAAHPGEDWHRAAADEFPKEGH